MKRLFALLLVLAMTVSLFAGCQGNKEPEKTETQETTEEVTEPAPREPLIPELGEKEDILTFRYEQKYLDLFYEKVELYEKAAMDGDSKALEALELDLEELTDFIYDQSVIAEILHYCNTKDEEASDLHLEMTDILLDLSDTKILTQRRIYESDSPLKEEIFADWTEEELHYLKNYTSEVKDLEKRQEEILVEVREKSDEELEEGVGQYYRELVANNNRTAEIFGYDNFYEYSYNNLRDRDYTMEEVKQLRAYAKEHCYEIFEAALERFYEGYEELSYSQQMDFQELIMDDYDETDYLEEYLDALPEEMGEAMEGMLDGYVIFPKGGKAREGAFTTLISGHPFCYFSRGYKTATTLAHEMGHYFGGLHSDLMEMPLDLAEIQSQGNEWLMIVFSAEEMDEEVYQCYLDYRFANDIVTVLIAVIIDEFEERVYTTEGVENFEAKDFDKIMEEVCKDYGGVKKLAENVVDVQHYWRKVALEHPGYYISYAVSMVPSLDIFFCASDNWDAAVEIYQKVTMDLPEDVTFLGILEKAGLASPFEDTLYNKLLERYGLIEGEETEKAA